MKRWIKGPMGLLSKINHLGPMVPNGKKKEESTNGTTGPARQNQRTDDTLGKMAGVSGRTYCVLYV